MADQVSRMASGGVVSIFHEGWAGRPVVSRMNGRLTCGYRSTFDLLRYLACGLGRYNEGRINIHHHTSEGWDGLLDADLGDLSNP